MSPLGSGLPGSGECGRERPDFDAVHLCTRWPDHSGQHLCPCGYRWDTAI